MTFLEAFPIVHLLEVLVIGWLATRTVGFVHATHAAAAIGAPSDVEYAAMMGDLAANLGMSPARVATFRQALQSGDRERVAAFRNEIADEARRALAHREVAAVLRDEIERLHKTVGQYGAMLLDASSHAGRNADKLQRFGSMINDMPDNQTIKQVKPKLVEHLDGMQRSNEHFQSLLDSAQSELSRVNQELAQTRTEAYRDGLTGLANRRAFDQTLTRCVADARASRTPLALAILDVDHFKKLNDESGHQAGDAVLRALGNTLANALPPEVTVARYGGEEFAILMPDHSLSEADQVVRRLQETIRGNRVPFRGALHRLTVSVGLSELLCNEDGGNLLRRADEALYASKKAGRDCCYHHDGATCASFERRIAESVSAPAGPAIAERRLVSCTQYLAPYRDGMVPTQGDFLPVQFHDISATGFSYVTPTVPDYDAVVVVLEFNTEYRYMTAKVVNYQMVESSDDKAYRVGCRFTGRLQSVAMQA